MNTFFYILVILNTGGLLYLAYLIIKKYGQSGSNPTSPTSLGIQKVGLYRYNPFDDLGGDQSFSLSILDSQNSGVILTSLHHRNFTRIYAKPVKNGQEDNITLSNEEKSAIVKAIKH